MTKKSPEVDRAAQLLRWRIERHHNILRLCRKPTHREQIWRAGYRAAMHEILGVITETGQLCLDQDVYACEMSIRIMRAVHDVAVAGIVVDDIDEIVEHAWQPELAGDRR
jgi:preprotein translocase subunit Sss1